MDVSSYLRGRRAREAERVAAREAQRRSVLGRLPGVAEVLRARFGASRVGYFGSLATGDFRPESDVDLFVDRIDPGAFWRAVDACAVTLERDVDLVDLERAPDTLRLTIERDGVDL